MSESNTIGIAGYPVELQILPGDSVAIKEGEKWDASIMRVNTSRETIIDNIRNSIQRQLPQLYPHPENPQHVALIGGGWSLDDTYEELRQLYFDGVKLVALNGSAKWLMERNLRPSMHIILDARAENAQFIQPIPKIKRFFASQVNDLVFETAAYQGDEVYIFHAIADGADIETSVLDEFYHKRWLKIPTAGTVGITSIMLLRMLGFRYQHLFGIDSCFSPKERGKHHAYAQSLNDNDGSAIFNIAGRDFECSAWQASQAKNFMDMLSINGEFIELEVHGDGMLAHILKTGADLSEMRPVTGDATDVRPGV